MKKLFTFSLLIIASLGMGASAQEAKPTASMEVFGAWSVTMNTQKGKGGVEQRQAQIMQETKREQDGRRICTLYFAKSRQSGKIDAVVIGPFGVDIASGVQLIADDKEIATPKFKTSLPKGIVSEFSLTLEQFRQLLNAKVAALQFHTSDTQTAFKTPVVLEGLGESWSRVIAYHAE